MKKVVHIHSDHKFIADSERYEGEFFLNELIILDSKNSSNTKFHNKALFFDPKSENLKEIIAIVNNRFSGVNGRATTQRN